MRSRWTRLFAILAIFTIIAAACGDDDTTAPVDSGETPEETATAPPDAPEETPQETAEETPDETPTGDAFTEPLAGFEDENIAVYARGLEAVPADQAMEPFKVGWINDDSGFNPIGSFGLQPTLDYINAELGGVEGHPIEVVSCDAGPSEETALACAQQMANDDDIQIVIVSLVVFGASIHNTLEKAGKPVLGMSPLAPTDYNSPVAYYISGGVPGLSYGTAAFIDQFLVEDIDIKKIAVVGNDNPAAVSANDIVVAGLEAEGYEVQRVNVPDDVADMVGPLTAADVASADVLVLQTSTQACIQTATALPQLGLEDLPVVTSVTCVLPNVAEGTGGYGLLAGWFVLAEGEGIPMHDTPATRELLYATAAYGTISNDDLMVSAGLNAGGFRPLMQLTKWANENGGYDAWTGAAAADTFRTLMETTNGALYMFGPSMECGWNPDTPTVCTHHVGVWVGNADGIFRDALDGDVIDIKPIVEKVRAAG